MPILLIVDDEKPTRDALRLALEDHYEIYLAANLEQAKAILESEPIDILLTDLRLGGDSGMDVLRFAQSCDHPPVTLMMTAYGSVDTAVEAMKNGAFHFVTKPLNLDEVEMLLMRAMRSKRLETENQNLQLQINPSGGLEKMLGQSPSMEKVFAIIRQVAPTKSSILIEGESGTGKELVAQAIHALSGRPKAKFVAVNCSALSPQLLESELFGHEKGSFTGAHARRIGRFEQAEGGTIFLDEIGEIEPSIQVKLLRVLAERCIERVGSNTPIPVNVRIITATNKSLKTLVEEKKFREDLFFRLHVVHILMPPLRERPEDLMLLAHAFIKELSQENGKPIKKLSAQAISALRSYRWPGNVRELRTAMEHGVIMSNSSEIELRDLPLFLSNPSQSLHSPTIEPKQITAQPALHRNFKLSDIETETITQALKHTQGNRSLAAELLGISRRTLQRKIQENQIHTDEI